MDQWKRGSGTNQKVTKTNLCSNVFSSSAQYNFLCLDKNRINVPEKMKCKIKKKSKWGENGRKNVANYWRRSDDFKKKREEFYIYSSFIDIKNVPHSYTFGTLNNDNLDLIYFLRFNQLCPYKTFTHKENRYFIFMWIEKDFVKIL